MSILDLEPQIKTYHTTIPSPFPGGGSPAFVFHLTKMVDTLVIWVGTGTSTAAASDPHQGDSGSASTGVVVGEKKLAGDWSVAMPSRGNIPVTATPIYRSGASDIALPMSQRLARKFPSNQIHLSLSLPSSLTSQSGPNLDPYASKMLLVMEKKLGTWLDDILKGQAAS
ncbi:hypothetical protein I317_03001 [Kwoniella heveanensis CBS 569]|nr:hypothetical protein I317_03001 [Kwoniella heveanensis CBS 569]